MVKALRFGTTLMNDLGVPMQAIEVSTGDDAGWMPIDLSANINAGDTMALPVVNAGNGATSRLDLLSGQWPRGRQDIDGVTFILPDPVANEDCLIRLNTRRELPGGTMLETFPGQPTRQRIRIPQRINAEELAFVHGYMRLWDEPYEPPAPPATVMTYRVHYDTGRVVDIPVRDGEAIRHMQDKRSGELPDAVPAFKTQVPYREGNTYYMMRWLNPHPEEKIVAVEVLAEQSPAYVPVVLSMSFVESALAYD